MLAMPEGDTQQDVCETTESIGPEVSKNVLIEEPQSDKIHIGGHSTEQYDSDSVQKQPNDDKAVTFEEGQGQEEKKDSEDATDPNEHTDEKTEIEIKGETKNDLYTFFLTDDPQLVKEQLKQCATILKGLKRHQQGTPFLVPVDPVALGIPDYPKIVTHPMDLSTISKKLEGGEYTNASQFVADVRLMLSNCFKFNAPDSQVARMGRNLEKYFTAICLPRMPVNMEQAAAQSSSPGRTPRRKSDSNAPSMAIRPRRESSTPGRRGSNAVVYSAPASSSSKVAKRQAGDITFCRQVLGELTKKTHQNINWPFMHPVDPVALGIPDYFNIIKHPMDLSTVRHKLDARDYATTEQFEADIRLVFANCYAYNAPDTDVVQMAKALEAIFEARWAQRPIRTPTAMHDYPSAKYDTKDVDDADEERILEISQKISALQAELNMLLMRRKGSKPRSASTAHHAAPQLSQPQTQSSYPHPSIKQKKTAAQLEEELNKPMTFEEKRQLSNDVNDLPPDKLFKVVEIIHDSMPNLKENADSDVIELDVETLDVRTLRKLQRYVREVNKKRKAKAAKPPSLKKPNSGPTSGSSVHGSMPSSAAAAPAEMAPFPVESSDESSDESGDE